MQQRFRKGDIVNVKATVRHDEQPAPDARVMVELGGYQSASIDRDDITLIRPIFHPGETAYLEAAALAAPDSLMEVKVIATHEGLVWVEEPGGTTNIALATDLQRGKESNTETEGIRS